MSTTDKTPCPRCGDTPIMSRHGRSYWKAKCPNDHGINRVEGHPMKTQREAWEQWEENHEVMHSKLTKAK